MKFFNIDNPVYNALSRVGDIFILNFLWIICSIPIITMGAATTALYYSVLKINRETDSSIIKMFFGSFRKNLRQGCILTVIFAFSGLSVLSYVLLWKIMNINMNGWVMIPCIILALIWGIVVSYAFPILAQFDNTILNTLKNALYLGIFNFKRTLVILLINALPLILFLVLPYVFVICLPILLISGSALIALINSKILVGVFDKYM